MKEKVLRDAQIRNIHEMGEMKRAQEQRIDEVSLQKLRENHETIQQLTSQLQQVQEKMNSMNDSGDFLDVESNYGGRFSHVSSQLVVIPSSRSMLSRDKRLPLGTWNQSLDHRKTFLEIIFLRLIHSEIILKENSIWRRAKKLGSSPWSRKDGDYSHKWRQTNQGTVPIPTIATRPLTTSSAIPVESPQNYIVGQQRQQISELLFDKLPYPQSFLVWKIRSETQVASCSDFPLDAMLWIKEVEIDQFMEGFSKLRDAGREDCICSEQDHPEFPVQEEGQPRGAESPERGLFSTRKTDRFHDLRLLWGTGAHDTVLDYADLFSVTLHDDNVQDFDTRWDEVLLPMSKIPSDDILESLHKLKDTWVCTTQNRIGIVRHGDSSEDIGFQLTKVENNGEEEKR